MTSQEQTQKAFLLGSIILGVLIIGGLVWAVASSSPTPSTVVGFIDDNDPSFGPADAAVTVRVFGDFQCPACRAAEDGFGYAKQTYGDKVRFVWDDFPLQSVHPNALPAANAARCAEAQGKFWEYHDRLYQDQLTWSTLSQPRDQFLAYAQALDLKKDEFATCYDKKTYQNKIMDDVAEGGRNRVDSTPTFFVNEERLVGVTTRESWDRVIQLELSKTKTPS